MASESNLIAAHPDGIPIQEHLTGLKSTRIYPLEEERIEEEDNSSGLYTGRVNSGQRLPLRTDSIFKDHITDSNQSPSIARNVNDEQKQQEGAIQNNQQQQGNISLKQQQTGNIEDFITTNVNPLETHNVNQSTFQSRHMQQKKSFIRLLNNGSRNNSVIELNRQLSMKSPLVNTKRFSELQRPSDAQQRGNRRNNYIPFATMDKQIIGRITYMGMQQMQNQEQEETPTNDIDGYNLPNNLNAASFLSNKKLSISWRFINILVVIQTFTNKLKLLGKFYRFGKLNDVHYRFINDQSHYLNEMNSKNTVKNKLKHLLEWIVEMKIMKQIQLIEVFKPEQLIVILWKTLIFAVLISQLIYIPIKIAFFDFNMNLSGVNQILLNRLPFAACLCDMLVNFNLAFFSAEGVVISERVGIVKNYLRFPFWLDLVTTLSLILQGLQFLDLCFLLRIFQIGEIVSYLDERFQFSQRFNTPYTLIKLIATIIVIAHIFGCGFYYMSLQDDKYNWVKSLSVEMPNPEWGTLYIKSLYFIIITMITVGFGDITPKNNAETVYVLGIALLSCFQFGYTVNIIGSLFQEKAQQQAIIKAQKFQISTYMRQRMISKMSEDNSLQMLVLKNLDYIQNQQIDSPEQGLNILEKVSENLRNSVRFDFYWRILKQQPILNHYFSKAFLKGLTKVMTERACIPGEFIYTLNQLHASHSFFILLKGQVDLTLQSLQERESKKKFIVLHKQAGDLFGHFSFFTSQPRETDCECASAAHLISCSQEDFLTVAKDFPKDYEKFCQVRDQIMLYQSAKDMKCLACGKYGHFVIDCPFIHLTNYKSLVIGKYNFSQDQSRSQFPQRKMRKHSSITQILNVRHALKKIRIKYIQKSEKEKQKRILDNDQTNFMQKGQSKTKSQEDLQNHSQDTSDISDYKYELEIEQQQRKLKLEGEKGRILAASDMYFYHRHPCIQFLENQVYTFSTDELSCSFSQSGNEAGGNSMLEDEDNIIIDQDVDYVDGDDEQQLQVVNMGSQQGQLDLEIISKGNILNKVEKQLVSSQNVEKDKESTNHPRQSCFNIFDHKNSIESASQNSPTYKSVHNKQGQFTYDEDKTYDDNNVIRYENHQTLQGVDFIPLENPQTKNNPQSQEQYDIAKQSNVYMSQSNEGDRQNASSSLKRASLDSNYINSQKNFFKKDKIIISLKKREPYPQKPVTQKNKRNGHNNNTPTSQSINQQHKSGQSPPGNALLIPESVSFQHIAMNRSKKKLLNRNNSFHSVVFSHSNQNEEGSTEKHSRNQNQLYPRPQVEEEQFLQLPSNNLPEIGKSHSKVGLNLHQEGNSPEREDASRRQLTQDGLITKIPSHISISRGSSLESLNMEISIDQEVNKADPALVIENQISRGRQLFITNISRNPKPNMDAIKQALLNKTNRDEDVSNRSSDSQKERKQFSISCLPMDSSKTNKISQGQDVQSQKDNQIVPKMKMIPINKRMLLNTEKPQSASQRRDQNINKVNNSNSQFSKQDRGLNPSIFIQQTNFNSLQKSNQPLPITLSNSGQGRQHNNGQKLNGSNNNNNNIHSINGLGNKPLRKQASIFLAPESNRNPRKTINSFEQNNFGHLQQLQQIQNDNNLHQQGNQANLQHLQQQQQPQQEQNKQSNLNQVPQEDHKIHPLQHQQKHGTKEEIDYTPQEEEFEIAHFDKPKCYFVYYPHNNLPNVLESLNKYQFKLLFISRLHLGAQKKNTAGFQQSSQQSNNNVTRQLNVSSLIRRFMTKH